MNKKWGHEDFHMISAKRSSFEPRLAALEAAVLARLNYVPIKLKEKFTPIKSYSLFFLMLVVMGVLKFLCKSTNNKAEENQEDN